ncbi:MAG TPA: glycosyltransferase family 4 protein [bacterium]|nr:glycosyltransferase family 4 protein [bacterium]
MNALVLAAKYFGLGGAEAYTRMFVEAIAANGARVDVLSLLDGEASDRSCPGRYLGDEGARPARLARARFVGRAVRHGLRYDLIVCSHVALSPIAHMLFRLRRRPYIVIGYGIDVWGALGPRRETALRRATRVVALSRFTALQVAGVHHVPEARLCVIHPAVDPPLLAEARSDSPPPAHRDPVTLLTVARLSAMERYKGCDTVIAALPAVLSEVQARRGPAVHYVIAGDGDDLPRLHALAERHGVAAAVTFAGQVQRSDLPALYRAADIYVMPSVAEQRPDGWAGEGFGIVYIEAAAFGRPVIAGKGGGAPEAVRDRMTGYVVDGRDVTAVAKTIARLAGDDQLRLRLGAAGRNWVEDYFTFERFRTDVAAAVDAAMGAGRGGARTTAEA